MREDAQITLVLGSHRAGTSAVTRLVALLDVDLGPEDQLLGPIAGDNERGFQEHRALIRLNDAVLSELGGRWDAPPPLPRGWARSPRMNDLRARARHLIERDFGQARRWGFKDPRSSITLPFWLTVLRPRAYVIPYRHPLATARSLQRRNQIPLPLGVRLWAYYTASAIANTSGARRTFVSYEQLFSARDYAIAPLATMLGRARRPGAPRFVADVDGWLDEGLRHHAPTLEQLRHRAVSAAARDLYMALWANRPRPETPRSDPARGTASIGGSEPTLEAIAERVLAAGPPPPGAASESPPSGA